jgi:predicted nucleic acid-binding protein
LIIYLDTSALLKQYVQEDQSEQVEQLLRQAEGAGTSLLTYAEMASAMARAARMGLIPSDEAQAAWKDFLTDWEFLLRLNLSSQVTGRAAKLAWEYGLRGYDAVHLASALLWQEALGAPLTLATFDRDLWQAGKKAGLQVWPE